MIESLIALISLLIGFYLGTKVNFTLIEEDGERIVKRIEKVIVKKSDLPSGIIKRPSAIDLHTRNEDPTKKAGKEAMKETLDTIPELQKAKEALRNGAFVVE